MRSIVLGMCECGGMITSGTAMKPGHISVVIADSNGYRREVEVSSASLECGSGCLTMRPGQPAYCRPFDSGILHLEAGAGVIDLRIIQGTAALTANTLHVLCEKATEVPSTLPISPEENPFPAHPADAATNIILK